MPKQILISTLGLSPGVVTGAYFILEREGYGRIDQIVAITSQSESAKVCERMIKKSLNAVEDPPDYLQLPAIAAEELSDSKKTQAFTDFVLKKLQEYGRSYDKLHINVSGGRKSMVAGTMMATQKFLAAHPVRVKDVHVFHLELLDETIEENGNVRQLSRKGFDEQQRYMNPPVGAMSLVQLQILPLLLDKDASWQILFKYAVGTYLLHTSDFDAMRFHFYSTEWQNKDGADEVDIYAVQTKPGLGWPYVVDRRKLRKSLIQHFNVKEMERLAWELQVEPDEIGETTRTDYAQTLISYLQRRNRLLDLINLCQEKRRTDKPVDTDWHTAVQQLPLLLVECKLRVKNPEDKPITHQEVQKLVNKMQALQTAESRQVDGWLVSNTQFVTQDALELAEANGVQLWQALLPPNWQERPDWPINQLTPIETVWA